MGVIQQILTAAGDGSVAAGNGVTLVSQILRQVLSYLHRRVIRHGVKMLVKLRQQSVTVPFHDQEDLWPF
jgi:2-C-methyl-D-erythritol 4-phosphate cytidylyltransferase